MVFTTWKSGRAGQQCLQGSGQERPAAPHGPQYYKPSTPKLPIFTPSMTTFSNE